MKVLLDTTVILDREGELPPNKEIGHLFRWLDNLGYQKYIHPVTVDQIYKLCNKSELESWSVKIESYNVLPIIPRLNDEVVDVSGVSDSSEEDRTGTVLLNEAYCGRVDILVTETRTTHTKARTLGIEDRVFTIDGLLEKIISEHPALVDYIVPSVQKEYFGNIDISQEFFETLKADYRGFEEWFVRKGHEIAYISSAKGKIIAFLYLKIEGEKESYSDIQPNFAPKKRLKIGTLKVQLNGYKLGERFLKIAFDNALRSNVDEIYVTVFPKRVEQERLIYLLEDFGFRRYGIKTGVSGQEEVYVRQFSRKASLEVPKQTYPFVSLRAGKFIVPVYPAYHTSLFPDSILRTESPTSFVEQEPHRNAISKVYVSRSLERNLKSGDVLLFYRTGGYHKSVITTIGIVENIVTNIRNVGQFKNLCKRRSVFSDTELEEQWNYWPNNHPFITNFLYAYSLPKRPNLRRLIELGVVADTKSAPRGFTRLTENSFWKIIKESQADESIIVD